MNFPSQVKTRSVVILLACMLFVSSVSIYYGLSASTPTSGLTDIYIEPPMMESSYIIGIYTAPSTCYLKNGTTGQITTGTFAVCLNTALMAMTTGGKVFIRAGRYNLTAGMAIIYSGIYIEGECLGGVGEPAVQIDAGITGITNQLITYSSVPTYYNSYLGGIKNIMFRGQSTANSIAVTIEGYWSDILFDSCGFMYFDHGVKIAPILTGSDKIWNIWFDNCLIEDNLRYGIYLSGATSVTDSIERVRVTGCHFYDNLNSIYCDADYVFHVTFTDNTVQAERGESIKTVLGGRQWIITDNHMFDCGIGANGTLAGIFVNGSWGSVYPDSWLIENNIIANHYTSSPLALNNSVWLTGTTRNFLIQGNFFYANATTTAVRLDGLNRTIDPLCYFKDNIGFVTENSGTLTDCVNATWIPHGLAGNPDTNGSITLSLRANIYFNATILYNVPTVIATNTTHFQLQFTIYETTAWAIYPVTTVEKAIVYWFATYKP